jgi:hypothetical protein
MGKTETIFFKVKNDTKVSTLPFIQYSSGNPSQSNKTGEINKRD